MTSSSSKGSYVLHVGRTTTRSSHAQGVKMLFPGMGPALLGDAAPLDAGRAGIQPKLGKARHRPADPVEASLDIA